MRNPFVGPRPLSREEGACLYGRDRELQDLFYLLAAERVVWLYSPSGAGKTSLVEAGLVPRLEADDFHVWPAIRMQDSNGESRCHQGSGNRYAHSVVSSLFDGNSTRLSEDGDIAALISGRRRELGEEACVVLIFDQFEEVLTLDPFDEDGRRSFFGELERILTDPYIWALFVLREEYWAALETHISRLTQGRPQSLRLGMLGRQAALRAMTQPIQDLGKELVGAEALVDDLALGRVLQADGSYVIRPGTFIEPVHLQVVCHRLWQAAPSGAAEVRFESLAALGDVDGLLASFFDHELRSAVRAEGVAEIEVRRWIRDHLISEAGLRLQVLQGPKECAGLSTAMVQALCEAHLLRAERRGGRIWVELSHDRLVEPVLQSNAVWFSDHLTEAQRRALVWSDGGFSPDLLLTGEALERAEQWVEQSAPTLTDLERRFLKEARDAEGARRRQARQTRRIRFLGRVAATAGLVACGLAAVAGWGWNQTLAARNDVQARLSEVFERDGTRYLESQDRRRGQAFLAESLRLDSNNLSAQLHLREALASMHAITPLGPLRHGEAVDDVAFSPDGHWVVTASGGNHWSLWHAATGDRKWRFDESGIVRLAFGADGQHLMALREDGSIDRFVDWKRHPRRTSWTRLDVQTRHVHIDTEGKHLLELRSERGACVWLISQNVPWTCLQREDLDPRVGDFDGARGLAALGMEDGRLMLWDWRQNRTLFELEIPGASIQSVALETSGRYLVTTSDDHTARIWKIPTGESFGVPMQHEWQLQAVAFGPQEGTVLSADAGGTVHLWNRWGEEMESPWLHESAASRLLLSPDGRRGLSLAEDGTIGIWSPRRETRPIVEGRPPGGVSMARFSPSGNQVVSLSADRRLVEIWDSYTGKTLAGPWTLRQEAAEVAFHSDPTWLEVSYRSGSAELLDWYRGHVVGEVRRMVPTPPPTEVLSEAPSASLELSPKAARWLALAPSGRWGLRELDGNVGQIIDLIAQRRLAEVRHQGEILWAQFSDDGARLATASSDGTARLWETVTGAPVGEPLDHGGSWVRTATLSPDRRWALTAAEDGKVRLWQAADSQPVGRPLDHVKPVVSAFFDDLGERVLTACEDGAWRIWPLQLQPYEDRDEVRWLAELAQVAAGRRLNGSGVLEALDAPSRRRMLADLARTQQTSWNDFGLLEEFQDAAW